MWFKRKQGSHRHGIRASSLCTWAGVWVWEKRRREGSILPPPTQITLLGIPGHRACLWPNALSPVCFPSILRGLGSLKNLQTCSWVWDEKRGRKPYAQIGDLRPYRGFHKAQSKFHRATPWLQKGAVGLPHSKTSTCRKTAAQRSRSQKVSQKANVAVHPTQWTRPFPMHTYLERAVKLKWVLLYMLMLMVSVIKDNSIYDMSHVEPQSESLWASPQSFFI